MNRKHRKPRLVTRAGLGRSAVLAAAIMTLSGQAWADPCSPADLNGDGQVDFSDYLAFLNFYDAGDLTVDYNGDGMVDFSDYLDFLNLYDAGCSTCSTTATDLAANPLNVYPFADHVQVYLNGSAVSISVDPFKHPGLTGKTTNVYITTNQTWSSGMALTDVRGGPQSVTWPGGSVSANTFALTGSSTLDADAGEDIGIPYDIVIDENNNGVFDACDFVDGASDAGFWKIRDMTQANAATAVTQVDLVSIPAGRTTAGWEDERWYYPTNIASRGQIPLVLISHGNGHLYTWYDFIGLHLASYGMIVVAHENNTGPGIQACKITQLDHMNTLVALQSTLQGGVLNGHIDINRLYTIGHSRGGDGVANLLDDLFEGTYIPTGGFPRVIDFVNYKYAMDMAGTDFFGPSEANPHTANFHLLYGAADGDVSGVPGSDTADSFNLFERATQRRASTYIHAVGHNEFNCCHSLEHQGPYFIGRPAAEDIQKAYTLAGAKFYGDNSIPCAEVLYRQYESFKPIGAIPDVPVDVEFEEFGPGKKFVIDDFQDGAFNPAVSSSGGAVTFSAGMSPTEGPRLNDTDGSFQWPGDVMNGMTRGTTTDTTNGLVFNYDASLPERSIAWDVVAGGRDATPYTFLSFRACQRTRHTDTIAVLGDQDFEVELVDGAGNSSRIHISAYGGGVEEPYQRTGQGTGAGWANEFETIRMRLTDFQADGRTLNLSDIRTVRLLFGSDHGTAQGALGLDDLEWTK